MTTGGREPDGLLLGLDVGTTRIKALVVDAGGAERGLSSVATPFAARAGGVEMDVAELEAAVTAAVAGLGPARERVAAVGVAGLAESGAPLAAGRPVGPVIAWHDGRGEETVAALDRRFGADLARRTGRRLRTVSSVAKLGWLLRHGLAPPDRWLGVSELVLFLLTGAEATEHSLAARTGAYDVTSRAWLPEVVAELGLPVEIFPAVAPAGVTMGRISAPAAGRFGLPAGVPVTIAGHDHLAAAAGLGARADDLLNSVGTAETLLRRVDAPPDVERALALDLAVTVWPGGRAWGVLASAVRSGLVIDALVARLGLDPATLDRLAAEGPDFDRPYDGPESDGPGGGATGPAGGVVALGQGVEVPVGPPPDMWTATLRALARRTAEAAERVVALTGSHRRLVVFGGGSRSPVWLRAKAAELGVPVVAAPSPEAAARGAALAGGVAAGWWPDVAAGPVPFLGADGRRAGTMGGP